MQLAAVVHAGRGEGGVGLKMNQLHNTQIDDYFLITTKRLILTICSVWIHCMNCLALRPTEADPLLCIRLNIHDII